MATGEEIHSTRGRARILFEALTTDLLPGGFADPALKEALDLCLSCKGCKGECPSSVDMAAYRAEFFFNYYRSHRRPLSSAFFGRMNQLARLASFAPSIANALAHAPLLDKVAKKALGIHPQRELPRFARRTFRSWFERRPASRASGRDVVLFPDTFNNFFEPQVAIAAVEVLERAGFRVIVPRRQLCCGRPLYDQGMLEDAKARLKEVMEALDPFVAVGIPIVGLEPSCILTFRDELPSLFPGDPRATALASNSFLLDELIVRECKNFAPPKLNKGTIVQGHCQQKALAGIGDEVMLLSRAAGAQLEVLDAGCCGMAGAFGYAREHFEVSKAIGARVLIPAIDKAPPDAIIVADGFSCRSQIRHFCPSRRPMHLAEVLNLGEGG
jgi:Fe-S oxidoreductase